VRSDSRPVCPATVVYQHISDVAAEPDGLVRTLEDMVLEAFNRGGAAGEAAVRAIDELKLVGGGSSLTSPALRAADRMSASTGTRRPRNYALRAAKPLESTRIAAASLCLVKAGVQHTTAGIGGDDLTPFAVLNFSFIDLDFAGPTTPTLVVAGDRDQSALSTRGPDWFTVHAREAFRVMQEPGGGFDRVRRERRAAGPWTVAGPRGDQ